jgi:two-component system phosphate regulon sensor histidine kinase PhoR
VIRDDLDRLAALIESDRETLLSKWRGQVCQMPSARALDTPTLNDHVPKLIDELVAALRTRSEETITEALVEGSPPAHGLQRVQDGFDIEEVVSEYNVLRGCIHDLVDEHALSLQGKAFQILNRVFDGAIGAAVQAFAAQRALEVQARREEYLAFVAHDLRTPLNAIAMAGRVLELTHPERETSPEAARMFNALRRNVQHLEKLVGKVLEENTNLRTETGMKLERREIDLWPLVEALVHDLHPVAGTDSTRILNQVPGDLMVYADAGALKRVFQNLIANAIRFTPRGEIVITAADRGTNGGVLCSVIDNGSGIPDDLIEKVFEKGETGPDNDGGTGLGLAIVKSIVEAHGGKVTVESRQGAGSTFRFNLPAK